MTGLLDTIRIRYPVPFAVEGGMVALMAPAVVLETVPITGGLAENIPVTSESCAEKTFEATKVPDTE